MISALRIFERLAGAGTNYELEVIAMVVVGGTALTGGRGTILGTVRGIFLLSHDPQRHRPRRRARARLHIFVGAIILGMLVLHVGLQKTTVRG